MSMAENRALALIRSYGGIIRTRDALAQGIHSRTLRALCDQQSLTRLSRGLYRLCELPPLTYPDLTIVAMRIPSAVICGVSSLAFHELTTQIPHAVSIALQQGDRSPALDHPPLRIFRFSGKSWSHGIETHVIDGVAMRVYAPAKAVADAFKLRGHLGVDVAVESLRLYRNGPTWDAGALVAAARVCRVERVMRPYVEAILS